MSIRLPRFSADRWHPVAASPHFGAVPPMGSLVAMFRAVYRVMEIQAVPQVDWDAEDETAYRDYAGGSDQQWRAYKLEVDVGDGIDWPYRPYYLVLDEVAPGKGLQHLKVKLYRHGVWRWDLLPEHFPVCGTCREPYPCLHVDAQREAAEAAQEMTELDRKIGGVCWHCQEPFTTRTRKLIAFEGENVDLPTGPTPVMFHLRGKGGCWAMARAYEARWVAADPEHRRARLTCPGRIVHHEDGPDCTELALCPGPDAHHASWATHHSQGDIATGVRCLRCADARARGDTDWGKDHTRPR